MLKLSLPFSITEEPCGSSFPCHLSRSSKVEKTLLWLEGLSIAVEIKGSEYRVVSECALEPDSPGAYLGTIWSRSVFSLPQGAAIEQQLMAPIGGSAIALSWRLRGPAPSPITFRVSPAFTGTERFESTRFEVEPETNGGRLTWRPYQSSSKIIADTNGRLTAFLRSATPNVIPATFEFDLGCKPAVLILSAELADETPLNPLIGGFLAGLIAEREDLTHHSFPHRLAA